jgi:DNA-binding NtrC family response regulator
MEAVMEIHPSDGLLSGGRSVTVMIADDETLIRMDLALEFQKQGWTVVEVRSADEALSLLPTMRIDVLVTDVKMPGKADGLDLIDFVHSNLPDVGVVAISAHLTHGRDLPKSHAFFPKPFFTPDLVRAIDAVLAGKLVARSASRANSADNNVMQVGD